MSIESFWAFVYKNFKTKRKIVICIQNMLSIFLLFYSNRIIFLAFIFYMLQAFVISEFANDGILNIYLYIQGISFERLVKIRVISKILTEAVLLLPVLLLVAVIKEYYMLIEVLIAVIFTFFSSLLKVSLQYKIRLQIISSVCIIIINFMFAIILFLLKLSMFIKTITVIVILLLVYLITVWIFKNISLENAFIK